MRAPERQWPLILDPVVITKQSATNIEDNYVTEKSEIDYRDRRLEAGYNPSYGKERIYLKFNELPALTSADVVIDARLQMRSVEYNDEKLPVNVHEVLDSWTSRGLNWSNKPRYNNRCV